MSGPLSAVSRALTNAQARAIISRFTRLKPHWEGGSVADILEALADTDSDLDRTEPFYEANPGLAQIPGAAFASRALIWSGQELTAEALRALLVKAELLAQPEGWDALSLMSDNPAYTSEAREALTAAARSEHDFPGWLAGVLASVAAELGSTMALIAGRPGSWEADLVFNLVAGTVGVRPYKAAPRTVHDFCPKHKPEARSAGEASG